MSACRAGTYERWSARARECVWRCIGPSYSTRHTNSHLGLEVVLGVFDGEEAADPEVDGVPGGVADGLPVLDADLDEDAVFSDV